MRLEKFETEYKGYKYQPWEEREPDVVKFFHEVLTPEGLFIYADFSPYTLLSSKKFANWIDSGMPERDGVGPLKTSDFA